MGKLRSIDGYFQAPAEALPSPERHKSSTRPTAPLTRLRSLAADNRKVSASKSLRLVPPQALAPSGQRLRQARRIGMLDIVYLATALALAAALWWTVL